MFLTYVPTPAAGDSLSETNEPQWLDPPKMDPSFEELQE